jgi:acetyl-CoA C-acetyltransferase
VSGRAATPGSQPVIVGVGQVTHKDADELVTPVELIERAVHQAGADAGVGVLAHLDRLFLAPPWASADTDGGSLLAGQLGLSSSRCVSGTFSGSTPQELVGEACQQIAEGECAVAVVAGGVADASVKAALERGEVSRFPPSFAAALGSRWQSKVTAPPRSPSARTVESAAGVGNALAMFALIEGALWAEVGGTAQDRRAWLGRLLGPLTEVAARHPDSAWFPNVRTAEEIATPTPTNRRVAEPYTKLMTSFPTVDMAGALIVTSAATAARLGVLRERWVYPWAIASCHETFPPFGRPRIERPAALSVAVEAAFAASRTEPDDMARFDLYSCFPSSLQMAARALGIDPFDRRGLSITGGLPYFGGPGAAYTVMAIAAMVEECRAEEGRLNAVVGVGGMAAHFSAGVYCSGEPAVPWFFDRCEQRQASLRESQVSVDPEATGEAIVETATVLYGHRGPISAPVIARLPDGRRTGVRLVGVDQLSELIDANLVGRLVRIGERGGQREGELR